MGKGTRKGSLKAAYCALRPHQSSQWWDLKRDWMGFVKEFPLTALSSVNPGTQWYTGAGWHGLIQANCSYLFPNPTFSNFLMVAWSWTWLEYLQHGIGKCYKLGFKKIFFPWRASYQTFNSKPLSRFSHGTVSAQWIQSITRIEI